MHIHFSDLPNGQEDDKWHQLLQIGGGAKAAPKGSLRLVANFKDHMILPLEEYDKLKQVSHELHCMWRRIKFGNLAEREREREREDVCDCVCNNCLVKVVREHLHSLQLLLSDDLTTIEILAKVFKDHHAELASTLIHIFCHYDRVVPILTACLKKSIDKEGKKPDPTLFTKSAEKESRYMHYSLVWGQTPLISQSQLKRNQFLT